MIFCAFNCIVSSSEDSKIITLFPINVQIIKKVISNKKVIQIFLLLLEALIGVVEVVVLSVFLTSIPA